MKTFHLLKGIGMAVVILFSAISHLYSQERSDEDWKLVDTSNEIEIYVQFADCDGESIYLFKLVNTSDIDKSVTLTIDIQPEPAYGPATFEQFIPANDQSTQSCDEADMRLTRMLPYTDELLSEIDVELTIN
jgi:hypothetical protein